MTLIVDGTNGVTFNDSSLQGAAASPYVLKNRIINGDMRIDQRNAGASVTVNNTSGFYAADRFLAVAEPAKGVYTLQRSTTAPSEFTNSLLATVTTAAASPSAGDQYNFMQRIEGFNIADLGFGTASAKTVTISFWVRSSVTGTFAGGLSNSAGNRSYVFTYTISAANTFEYKTITIAGDTSGTWLTDNGIGFRVIFDFGSGSSYQATAGSWGGAYSYATSGSTKLMATNGATFYITGVQLEIGTSATPFERRLYNQELANCQRYFYSYNGGSPFNTDGGGYARQPLQVVGTTGSKWYPQYPVPMRACPTVSSANMASAATSIYNYSTASSLAISSVAAAEGSIVAGQISFNVASGFSIGNVAAWRFEGTNSGTYIWFSAEL